MIRPSPASILPPGFYTRPPPDAAQALIGAGLYVNGVGGRVVETEAYDRTDPASHSFPGPTGRNAAMFGPPGHAYIYRSYGLHWCLNIVCGPVTGGAVLIRALEPADGLDRMMERRGRVLPRDLCRGPGRLCQALGITGELDGASLNAPPFLLLQPAGPPLVAAGPRIGITKAAATPWRFGMAGSPFLSRGF